MGEKSKNQLAVPIITRPILVEPIQLYGDVSLYLLSIFNHEYDLFI